jgi:hypothetical protein
MKILKNKFVIGLAILATLSGVAFARNATRTFNEYWGLAFPDGTIVLVLYPDESERDLTDVVDRFQQAARYIQKEYINGKQR